MNSFVSVEEENSLDEIDSVLISATDVNNSDESSSDSEVVPENKTPEVVLCTRITKKDCDVNYSPGLKNQRALIPVEAKDIDESVDLMYLPLETVLMNCITDSEDSLDKFGHIFDSDCESFDGFSDFDDPDFEGFGHLRSNSKVVKDEGKQFVTSTPVGLSRPSKNIQNYSKGPLSPICNTTIQKSEKTTDGPRKRTHEEVAEEQKGLRPNSQRIKNIKSNSENINMADNTFDKKLGVNPVEKLNRSKEFDYIGYFCDTVGCTISWLESCSLKSPPVYINNGMVQEFSEFAKKIDWEPKYIGVWIYRLKGIRVNDISSSDMRKINSILKRRKALSVNFAGSLTLNSKLTKFDLEEFHIGDGETMNNSDTRHYKSCDSISVEPNESHNKSTLDKVDISKEKSILPSEKYVKNKKINEEKSNNSNLEKPEFLTDFKDDINEIGPHCANIGLNVLTLNNLSSIKDKCNITNGIVYELYHYYIRKKSSLISLVYMLFKLYDFPLNNAKIASMTTKISKLIKDWDQSIKVDSDMPFKKFVIEFPRKNKDISKDKSKTVSHHISKKFKSSDDSKTTVVSSNKTFDLNSTKGIQGKITRGDIVYLYTKWLKKKMEGKNDVFVSDLSKDVMELVKERGVECIRIPVGTLMSSSVKLFEEFRKLSKIDMHQATTYLLEDWIEDIKSILSSSTSSVNTTKCTVEPQDKIDNEISNLKKEPEIPLMEVDEPDKNKEETSVKVKESNTILEKSQKQDNPLEKSQKQVQKNSDEFDVEKIVGYRIVRIGDKNETEYRVRWLGFTSKDDSWINQKDLHCPEVLKLFWEALNKQRAIKLKNENSKNAENVFKKIDANAENSMPYFGIDSNSSQSFFNLMVKNLKPVLVDYQHDECTTFSKRVKVSKREVLNVYDEWRKENQEHLLTGGNKKLDVSTLISRLKELMGAKKVRHFNATCIMDACYRMSLMKEKLKNPEEVKTYLSGDFIELMQSSMKHQASVYVENVSKMKLYKEKPKTPQVDAISEKLNSLENIEKETLIIAKFIKNNSVSSNLENKLRSEVSNLREFLEINDLKEDN